MLQNELNMSFNYEPVTYGEIKTGEGKKPTKGSQLEMCLNVAKYTDKCIGDVLERIGKKRTCFSDKIVWEKDVAPTIVANTNVFRGTDKTRITEQDIIRSQTFAEDYNFLGMNVGYICGMSVPPLMIKRVVTRLIEEGIFDVTK